MDKERENKINVILGRRRSGKSTAIANDFIPADLASGRKVVVVLTKANPVYDKFKNDKRVNIMLVSSVSEIIAMMHAAYNCSIYFDDARGLFGLQINEDVLRLIIHTAQMNCDLHFCYHSFMKCQKGLFDIADCFTIFETKDSPAVRRDCFSEDEINEINELRKVTPKYDHFLYEQ